MTIDTTAGETTLVVAPKEQPPRKLSGKRTASTKMASEAEASAIDRIEPLGAHSGKRVATLHRRSNRSIGSPGNLSG
jgi:hypothetical protein